MRSHITAIVLTWNSADFIEQCLDSLEKSDYKIDIIVVDNDSADNTRNIVTKKFPSIDLINTGDNLGYAGGNNVGVQRALDQGSKYVFILNPDTVIATDCVSQMLQRIKKEKNLFIISPKVYDYKTNDLWFMGSNINWHTGNTRQFNGKDTGEYDKYLYTQRLTGCAMLIHADAIREIGLMDERFFLFYEETDWSARFAKAGYKLGLVANAHVWHKASSSTGGYVSPLYQYYMTRNRLLFIYKHQPKYLLTTVCVSLWDSVLSIGVTTKRTGLRNGLTVMKAIAKGYTDFFLKRFGRQTIPR